MVYPRILDIVTYSMGFPGDSAGKESACNAETWVYPWVGKIPWGRERLPTPVFWPGEFHGLYGPWGHKESDTTERFSLTQLFSTIGSCLCILYRIATSAIPKLSVHPSLPL